jgi:signal transduction histidine kinase
MFMDEESLPEKLLFDQSRLTNILVNIASNAIKFTNKWTVILEINNKLTDMPIENKPQYKNFYTYNFSDRYFGIRVYYELQVNSNVGC